MTSFKNLNLKKDGWMDGWIDIYSFMYDRSCFHIFHIVALEIDEMCSEIYIYCMCMYIYIYPSIYSIVI